MCILETVLTSHTQYLTLNLTLHTLYLTLIFDTIHTVYDTSIIAMVMYKVGVLIFLVLLFDSPCTCRPCNH